MKEKWGDINKVVVLGRVEKDCGRSNGGESETVRRSS